MSEPDLVKLAVVGGRRGSTFSTALEILKDRVRLTAVCDLSEVVLAHWKETYPHIQTFTSYDELLEKGDCTAVFLATPLQLHAVQAVQAIEAGKHVLSEVVAATTLDECWQLVETVERTGLVYMLAENYCMMRPNMMVGHMVSHGLFGDPIYAEGAYIHDCRALLLTEDSELTWRGRYRRDFNGNSYPTHSLGPVCQWLGINQSDRLVSTATWMTREGAVHRYLVDHLGREHPAAQPGYIRQGDSATTVIQTERGSVIVLRVDWVSARPHNMTHYVLQGSRGAYISARHHREDPIVWLEGISPGASPPDDAAGGEAQWESLWKYSDEYEHTLWRDWSSAAAQMGHGGGDFFVILGFVDSIQAGTHPPIEVYDAVTWSAIVPLSAQSVARGNTPVVVPDFAKNR